MARKKKKSKNVKRHSFYKVVLDAFKKDPFKSFNFRQISFALGITDKASKQLVKEILIDLTANEEIEELKRGKYKLNPSRISSTVKHSVITGIVDMKQTGKAYVITTELDEDVFISANNTYHALNGDKAKVRLFPKRKGRKTEGRIVEIIERAKKQFVGIIEVSKQYAFLIPDDVSVPVDIYIPISSLKGAKNGEKAVAKINDWPEHSKNPFGEIIEVLGKPGDNNVEMYSILMNFGFPLGFPENIEKEAEKIGTAITDNEISKRRDFRNIFTCTIDPEDAKDFDDALSVKKLDNGLWEIGIHIADVSHYVVEESGIDKEAYERGTSIYLVDRVIPMLPEKLSNNVCSLNPQVDKLCFSAVFQMDKNAKVVHEWFGKTVINSNRRYNYNEVQKIIEGNEDKYQDQILILHNLASKLRKVRFEKGAIAFNSQEVKFILDKDGKPTGAYIKEQTDSNRLVEDFMLLANRKVAERIGTKHGRQEPRAFVYRVHDVPNPEKFQTFAEFVGKLGYKIQTGSRKAISSSLNNLFEQIKGKGEENMIESIAVRTMAKAEYSTKNIGHYGLAFKYYTHFTSPIRRYPDLMVHRLLQKYLDGSQSVNQTELEEKCHHSSIMERNAQQAERTSIKYKQAEYLLDKVGQEFQGLISGVSKWGIFVEIDTCKCEGMVSLKYMDDDFYYLDEDNYRVVGHQSGKEYKLGDPVRIIVRKIDLAKKQMDFALVS
jgi:ribonuclease R